MFHFDLRKEVGLESFVLGSAMPIIFLTRDPLHAALSAAIAKERKVFNIHVADGGENLKQPVALDPSFVVDEARYYAHWSEHWQERLRTSNAPHIVVTYDEYVRDRLGLINSIFRFLKVNELPQLRSNNYTKVTSEDVWDDVVNAEEVRKALKIAQLLVNEPRTKAQSYLGRAMAALRFR